MAAHAERIDLAPDEFAFRFSATNGVEALGLSRFLSRAATVANRHGTELRVVALKAGSLAVVIQAVKKSEIAQNAAKEFRDRPIDTSVKAGGAVAAIVTGIVKAIIFAMSLTAGTSPLTKAGAELVERHNVTQITIVTNEGATVVMDENMAKRLQAPSSAKLLEAPERVLPNASPELPPRQLRNAVAVDHASEQVVGLVKDAHRGDLAGQALLVEGDLYFRPDGYNFLVPIDKSSSKTFQQLRPGRHYIVAGRLETLEGQPDRIIIRSAIPS